MANDTTPLMLITNVGLAAASTALPQGPYIHIIKFEIGSAYGYTPDVNQTQLQGSILYGGDPNPANWAKPSDYVSIGNNTLNIILEIPPEAGPWEFGEVGIFAADSNGNPYLFAVAVFETPQTKFSSLGTNVVSSYQLNCLLKLQQSTAIFQIDSSNQNPDVYDIYQWSDVYPPSLSANPDIPSYNVREVNSRGKGSMLLTTSDSTRTLVYGAYEEIWSYPDVGNFIVQAASANYIQVTKAQMGTARIDVLAGANPNRAWLVQTQAGFWRSVSSVVASGNNYQLNLNVTNDGTYSNYPLPVVPQIGEVVHIYTDYLEGRDILYGQIINPPSIPLASPGTPGLAYGDSGTYMPGGGKIEVFGMLQNPSTNSGRQLTAADNLNNIGLASGVYWVGGSNGYPANVPFNLQANIYQHNIGDGLTAANGSDITQIWYPWNQAGGALSGVGGLPPYWRQGYSNGANWTNWMSFAVPGRLSPNFGAYLPNEQFVTFTVTSTNTLTLNGQSPTGGAVIAYQVINNSGANNNARLNSNVVLTTPGGTSSNGDSVSGNSMYNRTIQSIAANQPFTVQGSVTSLSGGGVAISQAVGFMFIPAW